MATLFYVCCRVISRVETFKYVTFAGAHATLSWLFLRNTICSRRVSIEWFCQMCYKLCNWKPRTRLVQLNARKVQLTLTSVGEVKNSPHARFFPSLPRVSPNILHRRPGCRLPCRWTSGTLISFEKIYFGKTFREGQYWCCVMRKETIQRIKTDCKNSAWIKSL